MSRLAPRPWIRVVAFVMALLIQLSACHSWHAGSLQPQPAPEQSTVVRLTLVGGRRIVLHDAAFSADTVSGFRADNRSTRVAVPGPDIYRIEFRGGLNVRKTTIAVLTPIALVLVVVSWKTLAEFP